MIHGVSEFFFAIFTIKHLTIKICDPNREIICKEVSQIMNRVGEKFLSVISHKKILNKIEKKCLIFLFDLFFRKRVKTLPKSDKIYTLGSPVTFLFNYNIS